MKNKILLLILLFSITVYSQEYRWFKGNTHTHTTNSDGDEFPKRVVRWYLDHDYNFLMITDHNTITKTKYLDTHKNEDFILIQSEEVTDSYQGKPLHINAFNLNNKISPAKGNSILNTLQNNIDKIRESGAVPQLNHPNWRYAFNDEQISKLTNVKLFEVYNVSRDCNNYSAGGKIGMEEMWDKILSAGKIIYGVFSDDTHNYVGEFSNYRANPGKGWIMVKASELSTEKILGSLENGDFYSSNGVVIEDIIIKNKTYSINIAQEDDYKYTTYFIGKDGKILKEEYGINPSYAFQENELYVRAKVVCSSGEIAMTQPKFIK